MSDWQDWQGQAFAAGEDSAIYGCGCNSCGCNLKWFGLVCSWGRGPKPSQKRPQTTPT